MALSLVQIEELFEGRGRALYGGERVTQCEHALQCASMAEEDGAHANLIAACLLHDLGHLLTDLAPNPAVDDVHQFVALPFLRGMFEAGVLQPVRLHVEAKRYLCAVDPEYRASLSPVSEASLVLQGGVLDPAEQRRFLEQPFATDAIRLRCLDDRAKVPGRRTPPLAHFMALLSTIALSPPVAGQKAAVRQVHANLR